MAVISLEGFRIVLVAVNCKSALLYGLKWISEGALAICECICVPQGEVVISVEKSRDLCVICECWVWIAPVKVKKSCFG